MSSRFDWEGFLRSRRYDYVQSGPRQVVVHCPFCGPDDPSHHMSINLDGHGWRCWRAPHSHYGRSPVGLVQKLLGCSLEEARAIAGVDDRAAPPPTRDLLADNLARLRGRAPEEAARRPVRLSLPREAHPLDPDDPRDAPFVDYLTDVRGYRPSEVRWLARAYGLHCATRGPWRWRLIFPVRGRRGELLTWTARAIGPSVELRYKQPLAGDVVVEAPRTLLGLDLLWSAPDPRVLVVTEGPLDAARISVSSAPLGVWATCLFGLGLTDEQCALLDDLAGRFPRLALLLDPGAAHERVRMVRRLTPLRVELPALPPGVGDPGDLTAAQATQLCLDLLTT